MRAMNHSILRSTALIVGLLAVVVVGGGVLLIFVSTSPVGLIGVMACYTLILVRVVLLGQNTKRFVARVKTLRISPPAVMQPDPALALAAGETITLRWQLPRTSVVSFGLNIGIRLLVFTLLMEFLLSNYTPDVMMLGTPFFDPVTGLPLWSQWLIVSVPILITVLLIGLGIFNRIRSNRQTIIADDRGITIVMPLRGHQFIAWEAIQDYIRLLITTGDQSLGLFILATERQYCELRLIPVQASRIAKSFSTVVFDPPLPTYRELAQRLLATITARSGQPLRATSNSAFTNGRPNAFTNTLGVAAQDVQQMPLAPVGWMPPEAALQWARTFIGAHEIAATQTLLMAGSVNRMNGLTQRWYLTRLLPVAVFLTLLTIGDNTPDLVLLKLLAAGLLFIILFRFVALPQTKPKAIRIFADPYGLHRVGRDKIFIPWQSMKGFGFIPPTPSHPNPVYAVFWEGATLNWIEAYTADRNPHDALHALIMVRAGLPMHLIQV